MKRVLRLLARIAGSIVGLSAGVVLGYIGAGCIVAAIAKGKEDAGSCQFILVCPPVCLLAATLGAAAGTTLVQKVLRQRTSFWKVLVGAIAGLVVGGAPIALCCRVLYDHGTWHDGLQAFLVAAGIACVGAVVGAVIGSGWGATRAAESQV